MNVLARHLTRTAVVALAAAAIASPASANLVLNGGFESGAGAPANGSSISLFNGSVALTSWLVTGTGAANIEWEGQGYSGLTTPAGSHFIDLTGNPDTTRATISQSFATVVGSSYRLTFIIGVDNAVAAFSGPVGVQVGIGSSMFSITGVNPVGAGNIWTDETIDFTATSALTSLSFLGLQGVNYIGLDNIDVELVRAAGVPPTPGAVPEPAPLALFGLGLAAIIARRRRTKAVEAA